MKRWVSLFILFLLPVALLAEHHTPLKLGVLAYRPKQQVLKQWQPIADYLQTSLARSVELAVYNHTEIEQAVEQRNIDLIITTANQFILLQQTYNLSSPLATLIMHEGSYHTNSYGSIIFTRMDRNDINALQDLIDKRIAAVSLRAFGGYQIPSYELVEAGLPVPSGDRLLITGQPQDNVIRAVLDGRADVGFVRAGLLETLAGEGKLDLSQFKIINQQQLPDFPYVVSTRLYPEWPVAIMPHIDPVLASRLAATLYLMPDDTLEGSDLNLHGFGIPANYDVVEKLLRRLRLPPFDRPAAISLVDLWHHYGWWISILSALLLLLAATSISLVIVVQRSRRSLRTLQQMAAKEKLLLTSLVEGVYGIDTAGRCIFINPAALNILGLKEEEVIGQDTHALFHAHREDDSSYPAEHCPVLQALLDGEKRELEDMFIHKDGHKIPVWMGVSTMQQAGGTLGAVVTFQDITERKQHEKELASYHRNLEEAVQERTEELRLARDAAEAANKAKSVFLANMSHELRTPLNAILGFSQLMVRDTSLRESQRESLDIINNSGKHLLNLINDVLEIAKIEAGKVQLELSNFDLHEMVREVADMMMLRARQKGLQLELDQSSEFPRFIKGDEARLRQILVNLVSNAVKFTSEGSVTMRLAVMEDAHHHLLIEIEDTGPGISESDQQRLFKPFVQLPAGSAKGGTGLGLSIVSQFVQMMEGRITVESTPGKGSLFRVELPLQEADETQVSLLGETQRGRVIGLAPGQKTRRILIVEDQINNQLLLSKLMTDIGMEVKTAENGEECIALYKTWRPDLIWMDRRMPVMDGEEATRRIRQLPGGDRVKIVAVTASAFTEEQHQILASGMDGFVRKPYRFSEIYESLAQQLGLKLLYRDTSGGESPFPTTLTTEMLAELDDGLRNELRDALDTLDSERITTVIHNIDSKNHRLAQTLGHLADNYDYPAILATLDETRPSPQEGV